MEVSLFPLAFMGVGRLGGSRLVQMPLQAALHWKVSEGRERNKAWIPVARDCKAGIGRLV